MAKDIRYLSKRRKNQLIYHKIQNDNEIDSLQSEYSAPNVASNLLEKVVLMSDDSNNSASCSLSENVDEPHESITLQFKTESNKENNIESEDCMSASKTENNEENNIKSEDDMSVFSNIFPSNRKSLRDDLQTLIVQHNVPHNTANELLYILKNHGHVELPTDVRVLQNTLRNASIHIKPIGNGRYVHFGIALPLTRSIQTFSKFLKNNEVKLNINIDGVSISKSSDSHNMQDFNMKENIKQLGQNMQELLRMQAASQIQLQDITQRLVKLENVIKSRALNLPEQSDVLIVQFLPLSSIERIKEFESLLKTSEEATMQFRHYLSKCGGNNSRVNIHRCLTKTLTNQCAMQCSWKGIRNNFRVADLQIIQIMKREIIARYVNFTEAEFDTVAAEWLRFARQRKERQEKANARPESPDNDIDADITIGCAMQIKDDVIKASTS